MKKLGLWIVVAVLALGGVGCGRKVPQQWTTGYEASAGYYQPDHSWLYYWVMMNIMQSSIQPSYSVYVPPAGYPPSYRPWMPAPKAAVAPLVNAQPATPGTGALSQKPVTGAFRASSGFTPSAKTPAPSSGGSYRSSSGFTRSSPSSGSSYRGSSSFSSSSSRSSASSGSFRSSGGFKR